MGRDDDITASPSALRLFIGQSDLYFSMRRSMFHDLGV